MGTGATGGGGDMEEFADAWVASSIILNGW